MTQVNRDLLGRLVNLIIDISIENSSSYNRNVVSKLRFKIIDRSVRECNNIDFIGNIDIADNFGKVFDKTVSIVQDEISKHPDRLVPANDMYIGEPDVIY